MKQFTDTITLQLTNPFTMKTFHETALFYDIETTGFSSKYNMIYFIGCAYRKGNQVTVTQFFSERAEDEADVLRAFFDLCQHFTTTISFNGLGFDMPFIQERSSHIQIPEHLSDMQHIDIYKQISPLKKILKLTSLKQKSIEHFMGIEREDIYSGGELIQVYQEYVKNHEQQKLFLLKLHNIEDILGMINILPILSYQSIFQGYFMFEKLYIRNYQNYDGNEASELMFELKLLYPLPKRISYGKNDIYISGCDDIMKCSVKLHQGEMKHFYTDYKNYYYLPKEDMAIHKSVAAYVDKDFREKAKASTCYVKKTGCFLPQYEEFFSPCFKVHYQDKISYFELTEDFLNLKSVISNGIQKNYILHLLFYLIK